MSFIIQPGVQPPLTSGGVAYATGTEVKITSAGTSGQVLVSNGVSPPSWGAGGTNMLFAAFSNALN